MVTAMCMKSMRRLVSGVWAKKPSMARTMPMAGDERGGEMAAGGDIAEAAEQDEDDAEENGDSCHVRWVSL
jgi:hypothetical protein